MRDLAGKVAVVTGAASGIGLALSRRLGAEGMRVMMADVEEPALTAAARGLADQGIKAACMVTDVSVPDSVDALAQGTLERFGGVHLVCNNAGVSRGGPAWQIPLATWHWTVGVNLFGVVHGIRSFVPHLIAQGEGHIVNTASVSGLLPAPWMSAYSATKHAVVAMSESLHHELAVIGSPVGVSVLCPGPVRSNIHDAFRNWPEQYGPRPTEPDPPGVTAFRQAMRSAVEAGQDPADIAAAVRDAVVGGKFWILTHPEMNGAILDRYSAAVEQRNPRPAGR